MLTIFLASSFQEDFQLGAVDASEKAAAKCGVTGRTVRNWLKQFRTTGQLSDGRGQSKIDVLFDDDDLSEMARRWVRDHASKKGEPNMTAAAFCNWINETLLPSVTLGPELPRSVCVET